MCEGGRGGSYCAYRVQRLRAMVELKLQVIKIYKTQLLSMYSVPVNPPTTATVESPVILIQVSYFSDGSLSSSSVLKSLK